MYAGNVVDHLQSSLGLLRAMKAEDERTDIDKRSKCAHVL